MNIKLKAMLIAVLASVVFVGVSYLIIAVTKMYPIVAAVILVIAAASIMIGMIYTITLDFLEGN